MNLDKSKYYQDPIGLWLIKAVLVFNVFCFSGFNLEIHAAVNESVNTELTESRVCKSVYKLKKNTKKYTQILLTNPLSGLRPFNIWSILNYNNFVKIKFRSYRNRILLNSTNPIKVYLKIPHSSSEDEIPLSLG